MRRAAAVLLLTSTLAVGSSGVARAEGPGINGAGSTWVQIALSQWASDVSRFGLDVDYQGIGSTAGRQNYMYNLIDFAATEIPYLPAELQQFKQELGSHYRDFQYMPDVAGGTAFMYHLIDDSTGQRITNLRLSADTVAKIFAGRITSWQHPDLVAENPGVNLPNKPLTPVVRSDSSGSSAQLSLYLEQTAPGVWSQFARERSCPAPCQNWPTDRPFVGQNLSSGVTNYVSSTPGTINYVEAGYALAKGFPVAYLKNASGNYALPTSPNVATALTHARLHDDLTQDLSESYVAPEPSAYPVSSYSYLITPTSNMDAAKGKVLSEFITYVVCEGQQQAPLLGYSPLPPNLVQTTFDAVNRINGHARLPDLSTPEGRASCKNPTFEKPATEIDGGIGGGSGGGASPGPGATAGPASGGGSGAGLAGGATAGGNLGGAGAGVLNGNGVPTGDGSTTGEGVGPSASPAQQLAYARRKAALSSVSDVRSANSLPLVLSALYVPVLVFLPVLRRRRRRPVR
jgi:phosphate ABC transporter phosphate-binding protein